MSCANAQWAYEALYHISAFKGFSTAVYPLSNTPICRQRSVASQKLRPNLLVTRRPQGTRAMLLVGRPEGLTGVELGDERRVFSSAPNKKDSKSRARLLQLHLSRKGFAEMRVPTTAASHGFFPRDRPPLLVHSNHLIGWRLGGSASPVYAHTIAELCRLTRPELRTLNPSECVLTHQYTEWEGWRDVLGEPGWTMYIAKDDVLKSVIRGEVGTVDIPESAQEVLWER